jgi:hypothetical protein
MLFVICDQNDIVQDVATEKANLSRGYTFPDYRLYETIQGCDIRIGDTFKDGILTANQQLRDQAQQAAVNEAKIQRQVRAKAIAELKASGDLPGDFPEPII